MELRVRDGHDLWINHFNALSFTLARARFVCCREKDVTFWCMSVGLFLLLPTCCPTLCVFLQQNKRNIKLFAVASKCKINKRNRATKM